MNEDVPVSDTLKSITKISNVFMQAFILQWHGDMAYADHETVPSWFLL